MPESNGLGAANANRATVKLGVEGMMCTKSCTPQVEAALRAVHGVEEVVVSLAEKSARVTGRGMRTEDLVAAVNATGKVGL